jgi:hypothetical protein
MTRQYYGIENLGLTDAQRNTLATALRALGANTHPNPCMRNHWRARLDGQAIIFEAQFNDSDWTTESLTARLAAIFNVDPTAITSAVTTTAYGPVVTFSRPAGTPRLRLVAFGGLLASWSQSHDAALAYLAANLAQWEPTP